MRRIKAVSILLSVVMLASLFTGCSSGKTTKITTEKFAKACEKLGLDEFELDGKSSPDIDDLEGGFYLAADEDVVEDNEFTLELFLKIYGFDGVIEAENIRSFAIAAKCTGLEDLEDIEDPEDLQDVTVDGAFAFQMTLDDDYSEDLMEFLADGLEEMDIKTKKLSDKEYAETKNGGYLRLHGDLVNVFTELADDDDLEDAVEGLKGDIGISVEVNGADIFIIAGGAFNAKKASVMNSFVKAFGAASNPLNLKTNDKVVIDILDYFGYSRLGIGSVPGGSGSGKKVGVSMPTKDLQRWNQDGDTIKKQLESMGYTVDLQYAGNKVDTQAAQIEDMINTGCKVLIIAAIERSSLGAQLDMAAKKNVKVIAYDRLLMDNENVDYYVTFDNYMAGQIQGEYIRDALNLDSSGGSFHLEITAGEPGDNNAGYFFNGAMDVLRPYIDSGKLVVVSGQTEFDTCATPDWSTATAQARAENIIAAFYSDGTNIDAWLCVNDSTALGVINALDATYPGRSWPVITGMDCDLPNVKCILNGKQAMSVFKDTRTLAYQAAIMADQILSGMTVECNDTWTGNNNVKIVPAFLCSPVFADINNYKAILIDSGYYTDYDLT